jgi:hypothetical protein
MIGELFQGKSILLIAPNFFGYDQAAASKLRDMGAEVTCFDDRPSNSILSKALIRIDKKLLEKRTAQYYEEISAAIVDKSFDIVFLLNPEALPTSFLATCKARWRKALYVMYMWDSINNRKHTLEFVPFCDRVFTFDKNDAEEHSFSFKPLFYIDKYASILNSNPEIRYDICFMGTLHSDRYAIAKDIKTWCEENNLTSFFYFFTQGKFLYHYNKLREKGITAPLDEVSFEKLTTSQITSIFASSRVVLDIQHPKQTGLTMRTLETLGAGKKLITTNHSIQEYDFYCPENILVANRQKPSREMDLSFFQDNPKPIAELVRHQYSIGAWLTSILGPET